MPLFLGSVAVAGLLAGMVVAGLPDHVPSDVVSSEIQPVKATEPTTSTSSLPTTTVPAAASSSAPPSPATTPPPPTVATEPGTTTTGGTTVPTTTIASPATVLVVVGNAGPADRLASRMVEILATYGYVNAMAATATQRRLSTEIYFAPGRDQEASHLAGTLGIPDEQVVPYPGTPITVGNEVGDLWLLVGNDWTQRFEGEASG